MKLFFTIFYTIGLCLFYTVLHGQYGNIWTFGRNAGVDFNVRPPQIFKSSISTNEGTASICDADGKLLFYTDGTSVWDANGNVMPNGNNLPGMANNVTASTTQGALIVPIPGKSSQYYVFSLGAYETGGRGRLYYALVDMSLNGGLGDVIASSKAKLLATGMTEQMTAVSGNRCNIWLIAASRPDQQIQAYNVGFDGIDTVPVTSPKIAGGGVYAGDIGSVDVSPDRTRIAFAHGNVVLYDFDVNTGKASSPVILEKSFNPYFYGISFSHGNSKLYAATGSSIFQFDLSLADTQKIIQSKYSLGSNSAWAIKRGPDGKMYIATGGTAMSVIEDPDLAGSACNYKFNGFPLETGMSSNLGLPNAATIVQNKKNYTSKTDTIYCADTVLLAARNLNAMNYQWQDGSLGKTFSAEVSGTYFVTYQDYYQECEDYVDTFHIVLYKNNYDYSTTTLQAMCLADTFLVEGRNVATTDYVWNDNTVGRNRVVRAPGTYWVNYNYNITTECLVYSDTFKVHYPPRDYELSFLVDTLFCVGTPITFKNQSEAPFNRFYWSYGDGSSSTFSSPVHEYLNAGYYEVQMVGWIDGKCADSVTKYITIDSVYPVRFLTDRDMICQGESVQFYPSTDDNVMALFWYYEDGAGMVTYDKSPVEHAFARSGAFPVQLVARNRICPDTYFADTINVHPIPLIDLGADKDLCWQGQPIILRNEAYLAESQYRYLWSTGDITATLKAVHEGVYTLTVTEITSECSNTETITIAKDCYIDIPNAFTPNGDGHNDYFFPRKLLSSSVDMFKMEIFNRWGQLVFRSFNVDGIGWDGKQNGKDLDAGVYIYNIEVGSEGRPLQHYTGNITLMR